MTLPILALMILTGAETGTAVDDSTGDESADKYKKMEIGESCERQNMLDLTDCMDAAKISKFLYHNIPINNPSQFPGCYYTRDEEVYYNESLAGIRTKDNENQWNQRGGICALSSNKNPTNANQYPEGCQWPSSEFDDTSVSTGAATEDVTGAVYCQNLCRLESDCNFWTWHTKATRDERKCRFYDTVSSTVENNEFLSGRKNCVLTPETAHVGKMVNLYGYSQRKPRFLLIGDDRKGDDLAKPLLNMENACYERKENYSATVSSEKFTVRKMDLYLQERSKNFGFSVDIFGMGASMNTEWGTSVGKSESVYIGEEKAFRPMATESISGTCIPQGKEDFTKGVIEDMVKAIKKISDDWDGSFPKADIINHQNWVDFWSPYKKFFQRYGSHMINEVTFGTSLSVIREARASSDDSSVLNSNKWCASVKIKNLDSNSCFGTDSNSQDTSERSWSRDRHEIYGVPPDVDLDMQNVNSMINSINGMDANARAQTTALVSGEKYQSIWKVLEKIRDLPDLETSLQKIWKNLQNIDEFYYVDDGMYCGHGKEILDLEMENINLCICGFSTKNICTRESGQKQWCDLRDCGEDTPECGKCVSCRCENGTPEEKCPEIKDGFKCQNCDHGFILNPNLFKCVKVTTTKPPIAHAGIGGAWR